MPFMTQSLFDERQWNHALRRYVRSEDFLRDILQEEMQEKVNDHQRAFAKIAVVAKDARSWVRECPFEAEAVEIGEVLEFKNAPYDLILHFHALHRVNDPLGQMVQSRLALAEDGVFLAGFLGGESLQELRQDFLAAEAEIYHGASPHIAPMIEIKTAGNLLARAGLALPVADNLKLDIRYQSLKHLFLDLRKLALTNPLLARRKSFTKRALFENLYAQNFTNSACEEGQIRASFELIFLTAYAPAKTQPQPLRPGAITTPFGANEES